MDDFIYKYFIKPVLNYEGYNIVNTLTYAVIALLAVYIIYNLFKKYKIEINERFAYGIMSFVLLGSTIRVVTDSIDNGIFKAITPIHELILNSHIYDYGLVTASPGIYIVIAALFFGSIIILNNLKKLDYLPYVGLVLWIPHFVLLLPFMKYLIYSIPIILLGVIPGYIVYKLFKNKIYAMMTFAHGLDGGATFFIIDYFGKIAGIGYGEQHVFSSFIGEVFGTYFTFYLLKVAIAGLVAYVLVKEKIGFTDDSEKSRQVDKDLTMDNKEKLYVALLIIIMGLAPGLRDVIRMVVGA